MNTPTPLHFEVLVERLATKVNKIKRQASLAAYTTFRIGGEAKVLIEVASLSELEAAVNECTVLEIPFKVLGCGSNILFGDLGYDGAIIVNKFRKWKILKEAPEFEPEKQTQSRHAELDTSAESASTNEQPKVLVRVASGMRVPVLMKELWEEGITGLEWFAGIPATVGGATYMNMHGGHLYFGELVAQATLLSNGKTKVLPQSYFEFDYDYCVLHHTNAIILACDLVLERGNVEEAKKRAKEWTRKKKIQPQRSAGCIFQNLTSEEQQRLDLPTPSTGYFIDKVLQMKGATCGGAMLSTTHAAFIENTGNATAKDVLTLIHRVRERAYAEYGLALKLEVEFLGEF